MTVTALKETILKETIQSIEELEELLSAPTPGVVETMRRLEGDILVLGAAGKMGPSLARMAKRASDAAGVERRVIAVSRFSTPGSEAGFHAYGVETIRCDLLEPEQLNALPDLPNVVYMAGMKFGSTGQEPLTWTMNSFLPGMVAQKYRRSRIVAFSTGNIYGMTPIWRGGSMESDPPAPEGEYAMSCLGRERIFAHVSQTLGIPMALIRLNYAVEMRYGVPVDIARNVLSGEAINLAMGCFNAIWQGDANAMALQAFDHVAVPAVPLNVTGPEQISVRSIAEQFGAIMGKPVAFSGEEASSALLSNGQQSYRLFGYPQVSLGQMIDWIADWVVRGGASLGKPTHFEARDGKF